MPYWVGKESLTTKNRDKLILETPEGEYATTLIVTRCDDEAYIRINDTSNDLIYCYRGLKIKDIKMKKIYLTNEASTVTNATIEILLIKEEV